MVNEAMELKIIFYGLFTINLFLGILSYFVKISYNNFSNLIYWIIANILIAFGYLFIALRTQIPDFVSIVIANSFFIIAIYFRFYGFSRLFEVPVKKSLYYFSAICFIIFLCLFIYFTYFQNDILIRNVIIMIVYCTVSIYIGTIVIKSSHSQNRPIYYTAAGTFFLLPFVFLIRILAWAVLPEIRDLFFASFFNYLQFALSLLNDLTSAFMFLFISIQRATAKQLESEERYRLLAENARDVIWTMELDGTITFISPSVEQMRGFTVEEAMHQSLDKILTPDSQIISVDYAQKVYSAFKSGLPLPTFRGELEYYCKDGSIVWTECLTYPIQSSDGSSVSMLGVTRDISERKQSELIIKKQNEELAKLNATKDKFFSIIAHDLKGPLGSMKQMAILLHEEYNDFTEQNRIKILELMKESSNRIYSLLEILLEWSRSQRGEIPFLPKEINFHLMAQNTIQLLKATADNKKIILLNHVKESTTINADLNMMNTIIRNLISNAIKFTNENGSVIIHATESNEQFLISVQDTGIGMAQNTIDTIFRIDVSTTTLGTNKEKGTGLGLVLCKEFVEKQGGTIWVESELGKGSKFTFTLPKEKANV